MMINHIITSSLVIIFVLLIGTIFENKISACLKYSLWLLVVIKLLLPFPGFESQFHILNFIESYAEVISERLENIPEDNLLYEDSVIVDENISNETNYTVAHDLEDDFYAEAGENQKLQTIVEDHNENKVDSKTIVAVILRVVYFTGVMICFAAILISNLRFYKAFKRKRKYISTYNDKIQVYEIEDSYGACLYGGFSPVIIVGNNTNLPMEQQNMILLHEYVHYAHGDHIWSMIRNLCVALYWYNPLVWMAASVSKKDSELACDEGTIKRLGKSKRTTYGQTLLEVVSKATKKNDITSAVFLNSTTATRGKEEMKKRISVIAKGRKTSKVVVVLVAILSIGCIGCTWGNPTMNADTEETAHVEKKEEVGDLDNITEYDHVKADERGYRWLSDETYIYEFCDLDQNGAEEYAKVYQTEEEQKYICNLSFYWNGEAIYEYENSYGMSPGKAEYLDLDKDGKKEVFLSFWPNVNSMPLVEYIVLKQKADMSWESLEMIHGEEISQNAFPISITKGKNEWEAIISCGELEKKVIFDISYYHSQLLKMREKANSEEKSALLSLINDYKYGFPETSEWYTFGTVCAWGIWNIQSGEYQGKPCLIATHGIQGYDKFDFWGELDVYFDYDAQGKTRFLDIKFRNSKTWDGTESKDLIVEEVDLTAVKKRYVWPTVSTTISNGFGERMHPITGELKMIDYLGIAGKTGDSVYAVADGHIMDVGFDNALGNYIVLSTATDEEVIYGHLDDSKIAIGAEVKAGDIIGMMGQTGNATGPFLSISVKIKGEAVDPIPYFSNVFIEEIITYNGKEYKKSELCNATLQWLELSEKDRMLSSYFPPEFMIFDETWGISLNAKNITSTGLTIVCTQSGGELTGELQTGSWYILETWTREYGWKQMPYVIDGEIGWNDIAWIIPMNDTCEWEVNWEWLYGKLPTGKYRIGKEITDFRSSGNFDTAIYYAEFEINN